MQAYKERLEAEKEKLLSDLAAAEAAPDFGSDVDGFDEEADEAEETANERAAGYALRERIAEIDAALNKMKTGAYGACEKCDKKISDEMLAVVPESRLCETCKQVM